MNKRRLVFLIILAFGAAILATACLVMDILGGESADNSQPVEKQVEMTLTALAAGQPSATPSLPEATIVPTEEPEPKPGRITGSLAYPSEFLPPQRVVAFRVEDLDTYFITEVTSGSSYTLEVSPGTYYLLAYLISPEDLGATPGLAGAYSEMVPCGLSAGCEDHSLIPVSVAAGETVAGIDPVDWYLPASGDDHWPGDPTQAETGAIRGSLGYPSEYIPPLRVVAFDLFSQDYYYVDTQLNQAEYELSGLPPSTYHVVAYVREQGPDLAGGYSYFVTCGMTQDCNNHSLVEVNVYAGRAAEGVDPIDFYIQPGEVDWPLNPTQ